MEGLAKYLDAVERDGPDQVRRQGDEGSRPPRREPRAAGGDRRGLPDHRAPRLGKAAYAEVVGPARGRRPADVLRGPRGHRGGLPGHRDGRSPPGARLRPPPRPRPGQHGQATGRQGRHRLGDLLPGGRSAARRPHQKADNATRRHRRADPSTASYRSAGDSASASSRARAWASPRSWA